MIKDVIRYWRRDRPKPDVKVERQSTSMNEMSGRAKRFATQALDWPERDIGEPMSRNSNTLEMYFESHRSGRGIWKWRHYFEIYERHFTQFINKTVHIVEVGIYSGGSLDMWQHYFGSGCYVYGVDIAPECKAYESDRVKILTGDQADRNFWRTFKEEVPRVDILIDDGGHQPEQQIVTLEEMLPHLSPGGIYLCEDVHVEDNQFAEYARALAKHLNAWQPCEGPELSVTTTAFQSKIHSIHFYPFVTVIEKHTDSPNSFTSPRRGTEWQPFYDETHHFIKR